MKSRLLAVALVAFLCASLSSAYSDISLNVKITVSDDGSAHVVEIAHFSMNTPQELEAFDFNVKQAKTSISDWSKFSPGRNIRYHVRGETSPANITINAKRDYTIGYSVGQVVFEYDIEQLTPGSGIGRIERHDVTSLNLDFDGTTDETSISKDTTLTLALPVDAVITRVFPKEDERKDNVLSWKGPQKAKWFVSYETEQPLGEEASEFFLDLYRQIISFAPAAIVLLILGFLGFKYWQSKER